MRIRYAGGVAKQLAEIVNYIAKDNRQAALAVGSRIEEVIALLSENPHLGRSTTRRNTRVIVAYPYPYLIYYRIKADEVFIMRVRHSARSRSGFHEGREIFRP